MTKVQMRGDKGRQIEGAEDGYHGKRGNTSSVVCQEKEKGGPHSNNDNNRNRKEAFNEMTWTTGTGEKGAFHRGQTPPLIVAMFVDGGPRQDAAKSLAVRNLKPRSRTGIAAVQVSTSHVKVDPLDAELVPIIIQPPGLGVRFRFRSRLGFPDSLVTQVERRAVGALG